MPSTYLQFHLVFTLPPLLLLWYLTPTYEPTRRRRGAIGLAILVAIAVAYTTPWGSYMIQRGAWAYGEGVVTARLLSIPLGEYLFFGIQTLTVGFYLYWRGFDPRYEPGDFAWLPRIAGVAAGVALFGGGLWMVFQRPSWLYIGGLLAWVGPVVALQWAVGGGYLVRKPRAWIEASLVPTVYLWIIDRWAIGRGLWILSDRYTTGVAPFGLPIEEILFFLSAGVMTVTGLVLFEWVVDWNDQRTAAAEP
ncbi:lycopene cyclase domain-containing protein [Halonotius terrestris]|uniref:Lycopene cyclase domain-containing protein n=1 Tax=Halonotius terrestris TaxID=2487750 RepID=A0A8J8PCX4_9EURY|nr:lycopene cyclase domain-containing protein [Halonotius terrestris]TQQ82688.1 lycopene cyclase domain-containing protein [Halonotius terrestris]